MPEKNKTSFYEDRFLGWNHWSTPRDITSMAERAIAEGCLPEYRDVPLNQGGMQKKGGVYLGGVPLKYLVLLDQVWEKEIGILGRFCTMTGIRTGSHGIYITVKPSNAAAASELSMRSKEILRNINKYFPEPWIKGMKIN